MATKKKDEPTTPQAEATNAAAPVVAADEPPTTEPTTPEAAVNAAAALMATKTIQLPETPVKVLLARVKADWPHSYLQSAGTIFTHKTAVPIRADDPNLAELRANPYLELSEE